MHPELEGLIEAILTDAEITTKERAVLHKKSVALGVDPDEVDVIIDARLHALRKSTTPTQNKPRKCPSCGEPISGLNQVCESCGHVFDGGGGGNNSIGAGPDLHATIAELEDWIIKIKAFKIPGLSYYYYQSWAKSNRANPMINMMGMGATVKQYLSEDTANYDILLAEAEALQRRVHVYFGEDRKIRVLLDELDSEINKKTVAVTAGTKRSVQFSIVMAIGFVLFWVGLFWVGTRAN